MKQETADYIAEQTARKTLALLAKAINLVLENPKAAPLYGASGKKTPPKPGKGYSYSENHALFTGGLVGTIIQKRDSAPVGGAEEQETAPLIDAVPTLINILEGEMMRVDSYETLPEIDFQQVEEGESRTPQTASPF